MTGLALDDAGTDDPDELRAQIDDLQQALAAIRDGAVDAVVPGGDPDQQLYSQVTADRPYRVIVEEMGDGALTVSGSGTIVYANRRFAELLGTPRTALLGRHVTELVDHGSSQALRALLGVVPGENRRGELSLLAAPGATVPVLASMTGLEIDGVVTRCLIAVDLTDRRRAEAELADAYTELRRAATELEGAQRIGSIGSWSWNTSTDHGSWSAQMYRIAGVDPAVPARPLHTAGTVHPDDVTVVAEAIGRVLADGRPLVVEHRFRHPDGGVRYVVTRAEVVPGAHGAVVGVRGTTQDVSEQHRSAVSIAEARDTVVRQTLELAVEHEVKESLQRAVLPSRLPDVAGVELAARYLPADQPAMVGGDWYDAFCLPGGGLAVAVGDVVGHDLDAAATMGRLRNALRAYAFDEEPPHSVLTRLNRLSTDLDDGGLATALCGQLEPDGRTFRWASAGHLPPLVVGPAGVRFLPTVVGTMLGARRDAVFADATTVLGADELVLLYTDGLIERRDRDLDAGFAALADAAADLVGEPAEVVCSTLLERLLPGSGHDDDVCLLALRVPSVPVT